MRVVPHDVAACVALDGDRPLESFEETSSVVILLDDLTLIDIPVVVEVPVLRNSAQDAAGDDEAEGNQPVPTGRARLQDHGAELVVVVEAADLVVVVPAERGCKPPDQGNYRSDAGPDQGGTESKLLLETALARNTIEIVRDELACQNFCQINSLESKIKNYINHND